MEDKPAVKIIDAASGSKRMLKFELRSVWRNKPVIYIQKKINMPSNSVDRY